MNSVEDVLEAKFHLAGLGSLVASDRAKAYLELLETFAQFRSEHEL